MVPRLETGIPLSTIKLSISVKKVCISGRSEPENVGQTTFTSDEEPFWMRSSPRASILSST